MLNADAFGGTLKPFNKLESVFDCCVSATMVHSGQASCHLLLDTVFCFVFVAVSAFFGRKLTIKQLILCFKTTLKQKHKMYFIIFFSTSYLRQ